MDTLNIVKADYQRFPYNQTYTIYAEDVYFKDPLNEFRGIKRYQDMIGMMTQWLKEMKLEVQEIYQQDNIIHTKWRLSWTTPLPWKPSITIPGRSELILNEEDKIISHIDYWDCSKWEVIKQHFSEKKSS
ncbi:MAG: DUF2358 domain-containing protein [Microcystaceae cyanobacterium]